MVLWIVSDPLNQPGRLIYSLSWHDFVLLSRIDFIQPWACNNKPIHTAKLPGVAIDTISLPLYQNTLGLFGSSFQINYCQLDSFVIRLVWIILPRISQLVWLIISRQPQGIKCAFRRTVHAFSTSYDVYLWIYTNYFSRVAVFIHPFQRRFYLTPLLLFMIFWHNSVA